MITFTIEGPAVPKQRPRIHGRMAYTPKKTRDYEERVRKSFCSSYYGLVAEYAQHLEPPYAEGVPVRVQVEIIQQIPKSWSNSKTIKAERGEIVPTTRNGDLDNICKSILDALNGYAYADDAQVTTLIASKKYGVCPFVTVSLEEDRRTDKRL